MRRRAASSTRPPLRRPYFHGDNGAGLGATHQTGWTGLIADVIRRRHGAVTSTSDMVRGIPKEAQS